MASQACTGVHSQWCTGSVRRAVRAYFLARQQGERAGRLLRFWSPVATWCASFARFVSTCLLPLHPSPGLPTHTHLSCPVRRPPLPPPLCLWCLLHQDSFAGMVEDAGFKAVGYEDILGGVVAMHSGFKL